MASIGNLSSSVADTSIGSAYAVKESKTKDSHNSVVWRRVLITCMIINEITTLKESQGRLIGMILLLPLLHHEKCPVIDDSLSGLSLHLKDWNFTDGITVKTLGTLAHFGSGSVVIHITGLKLVDEAF